jgi:hypothetical protein
MRRDRNDRLGKVAEHLVLAELILRNLESYPAISFRQEHFDITVVREDLTVARVQVKATELQNDSTNNSIDNLDKNYHFLVLVVFDNEATYFLVLTKAEVEQAWTRPGTLYTSRREKDRYIVRENLMTHKDKWEKIINSGTGITQHTADGLTPTDETEPAAG